MNRFMESPAILTSPSLPDLMSGTSKQQQAGLNLRIFGANEQDSTLVAKIGKFNRNSGFEGGPLANASGTYYGGEMALYFLNCFGLEGNYIQYKPVVVDDERASATSSDYNVFLEVFNLRLGYGIYQQLSHSESLGQRLDLKETGQQLSLRLFF
ncbi:MAG: hypothetical protein NTX25_15395 [Proteobacteria bacterium]|nr:hypothetical protein [Pseudomonadota bacterium]